MTRTLTAEATVTTVATDLGTYFLASCDCDGLATRTLSESHARRLVRAHVSASRRCALGDRAGLDLRA